MDPRDPPELRRTELPDRLDDPELRAADLPLLLDGGGRLTEDREGALRCVTLRCGADRVVALR